MKRLNLSPIHAGSRLAVPALLSLTFACSDAGLTVSEPIAPAPAAEATVVAAPPPGDISRAPTRNRARSGVLTAGDIDDGLNIEAFQRYVRAASRRLSLPTARLGQPIQLKLVGYDGSARPGQYITLRKPGAAEAFYAGYSGTDGNITVFPGVFGQSNLRSVEMRVFDQGVVADTIQVKQSNGRRSIRSIGSTKWQPDFLDLAFVIDTTGSMGDELAWLTKDIARIVNTAKRSAPGVNIRYGLVVYRDKGDAYVVRNFGFTPKLSVMRSWLSAQDANGGGDYPEAAAQALKSAAALNWRRGKGERILFHVADAPPHLRQTKAYLEAARTATRKNVQIFGLGASGVGPESELAMRQASVMSGGRYLFLTDDSGVGYGHAEPTIACYRVTKLNDLMIRVLRSELTGKRIEAPERAVIRNVGHYRNGVCAT